MIMTMTVIMMIPAQLACSNALCSDIQPTCTSYLLLLIVRMFAAGVVTFNISEPHSMANQQDTPSGNHDYAALSQGRLLRCSQKSAKGINIQLEACVHPMATPLLALMRLPNINRPRSLRYTLHSSSGDELLKQHFVTHRSSCIECLLLSIRKDNAEIASGSASSKIPQQSFS